MKIKELKDIGFKFGLKAGHLSLSKTDYYTNGATLFYQHKTGDLNKKEDIDLDNFFICNDSEAGMTGVTVPVRNIKSIEDILKLKSIY